VIDASGLPLAVGLSAANTHDSQLLEPLVDAVPAVIGPRGRPGRPRQRPAKLHADKGYDYPTCRRALRRRGIRPRIARRGLESSQRLGRHRWKVERSLAWLLANRRLTVRYDRCETTSKARGTPLPGYPAPVKAAGPASRCWCSTARGWRTG
jgi:transposase